MMRTMMAMLIGMWMGWSVWAQGETCIVNFETAWREIPLAGFVEAERDRVLITNRMAEVVELNVQQGENVKQGDVLIRLEDRALQQQKAALEEALDAQKSVVAQAGLQVERMARLLEKGAVAKVQWESADLNLQGAEAKLQEIKAQIQQVKEMQSYLEISADADGQLVELNVSLGDTAMPGHPLGRFVTSGVRTLRVLTPDHVMGYVEDARWEVKPANRDTWQETRVVFVSAVPEARTSENRVYLETVAGLVPNQRVDVRMLVPTKGVFLPPRAFEQRGNMSFVRVMGDKGEMRRLVHLGPALADGRREVMAGLSQGEEIIMRGGRDE